MTANAAEREHLLVKPSSFKKNTHSVQTGCECYSRSWRTILAKDRNGYSNKKCEPLRGATVLTPLEKLCHTQFM